MKNIVPAEKKSNSEALPKSGTIDWSVLDQLKMLQKPGKPDLRKQLMSIYLASSVKLMQGIRRSIEMRDDQGLMRSAHALTSSSRSLGAMGLGKLCASLEQFARSNILDDAPLLLEKAETEFNAVCSAFRQALDKDAQ